MKVRFIALTALIFALAACQPATPVNVPTLMSLPPATATIEIEPSPTLTSVPPTEIAQVATLPADTSIPTLEATAPPSATDTLPPTLTLEPPTATPTFTLTLVPSLTITDTITPTLTDTPPPTPDLGPFAALALAAANVTVLPIEQRYPPPTLTALAQLSEQLRQATLAVMAPTIDPNATGAVLGITIVPAEGSQGIAATPGPCPTPFTGGLGSIQLQDPALTARLGCPVGGPISITAAYQPFEHGAMIYTQGIPGSIYALGADSRYRRFDDTWVEGVDPDSMNLTAPPDRFEPIRGFGKVWRANADVQSVLGWAVAPETGQTASLQQFDFGRAIYLPAQNQTYLLVEDSPGATDGTWRVFNEGF